MKYVDNFIINLARKFFLIGKPRLNLFDSFHVVVFFLLSDRVLVAMIDDIHFLIFPAIIPIR